MNIQPIFDLVQICHLKGIKQAIISPGSRNAALTVAFSRHPDIQCFSVPDERSAAFIGLGMSLKSDLPTVLICTSGSAALNYAPAVSEAFFNQVPLLIISADRPPEWIGQRDGQTIYQENLFGKHVKKSFVYPSLDESVDAASRRNQIIEEAIDLCMTKEYGPVHINIPFREPFYPDPSITYQYPTNIQLASTESTKQKDWKDALKSIADYSKILILIGQGKKNESLNSLIEQLSTNYNIPVISDIISNGHEMKDSITTQDVFLRDYSHEDLQPDLLITIGMSVISKNLKIYLRKYQPKSHWHVREEDCSPDPFQSLSRHLKVDALEFFQSVESYITHSNNPSFYQRWQEVNRKTKKHITQHSTSASLTDIKGYQLVLNALPPHSDLHLANSMAVRYANVVGLNDQKDLEVFCNRGTSGIDGSNSTAVGSALLSDRPTFLLTGDLAFLYDRNAFWHNHVSDNLNIVVFNNHGGGIFRMIEGPSQQDELEEFFETRQKSDAKYVADEFGFSYYSTKNVEELKDSLAEFLKPGKRKILEIFTDAEESKSAYKELFRSLVI